MHSAVQFHCYFHYLLLRVYEFFYAFKVARANMRCANENDGNLSMCTPSSHTHPSTYIHSLGKYILICIVDRRTLMRLSRFMEY